MNFLSKKVGVNLVTKTIVVASIWGAGTYIISNQNLVNAYATVVNVESITVTGNETIKTNGGTWIYTANFTPYNATNKAVTWTSSDSSIASVNSSGLVTAKADGIVTITATAKDGSGIIGTKIITISGQVPIITPITSVDVKMSGITVIGNDNISTDGGSIYLTANVFPSNASNKSVTWRSSDNNVASVSSSGLVTAKTDGNVTITAITNDGSGVIATKVITVSGQTKTASISSYLL